MEVIGRVEVGAVVGRELHRLDSPTFAVGQVLLLQPGEERGDLLVGVLVRKIGDLRLQPGWVGGDIVLEVMPATDQ